MSQDRDEVFRFLARIEQDPELRERLNLIETADEVAALASDYDHVFDPATLLALFELCNEAPRARAGLMDEKLIRVFLQRDHLL